MRPPSPYFGGKQRIADRIVELMPKHGHYVEPFAGGLSILLAKPESKLETVNDLDSDIMTFWRVLRDRGDELTRVCELTPHSRGEYITSHDRADLDDLERARRVWVQLTQGRAGQLTRTGWRHNINPQGTSIGMPRYLDGYMQRFAPVIERLKRVSLENRPALDVIRDYGIFPDALLYVDPPYPASVRGGAGATNAYRHELKADGEHVALADALHSCAATVILSGYPSPLYDDLFQDWHQVRIETYTGQGNRGGTDGHRTEVLWSNRVLEDPHAHSLDFGEWTVNA
jgi:DNA adenine methylase